MISAAAAVILLFAASVNESARAVNVTITDFQTPWVTGTQYGAGVKTQGLGHCTHDSLQFEKKQTGESYEEQDCSVLTWIDVTGCYHVRVVAPLLADKFIGIGTDGKISNRAKNLADAKATKFSSVDIEDLHITVVGHTAIAVMVFKAKGTDEKGKPMDINARWADTWVKMPSGAWQCVLSQGSSLKP